MSDYFQNCEFPNFLLAHSIFDIVVQINDLILFPVSTMLPFPLANTTLQLYQPFNNVIRTVKVMCSYNKNCKFLNDLRKFAKISFSSHIGIMLVVYKSLTNLSELDYDVTLGHQAQKLTFS